MNSDHTAARLEQLEIHYLEFNTDTLTKEVIQLLETREHSDQLQAALLLKEHKENQKTKETVKEDVESADPNAPKGTPKSTLNIAGGPQTKQVWLQVALPLKALRICEMRKVTNVLL